MIDYIYIVVNVCLNMNQTRQHEDKLLRLRNNMARPLAKVKMNNNFPFSQYISFCFHSYV